MKSVMFVVLVLLLLICVASVSAQFVVEDLYDEEFTEIVEEDIYEDVEEVQLTEEAGMTPDSAFYVVEDIIETVLVGNNPKTALKYKEEKVLEAKKMVELGNKEAAKKALSRIEKYNQIIKKEVSPDIEKRVRESSKAVKKVLASFELEDDRWEDVREIVDENLKEQDELALAAKISKKISELCKVLSDLDPLEYSRVCKTDDDPKWKRKLDKELTKEQKKEAEEFFEIMSECFENPTECKCDDISVKPFADKCNVIAPLATECEAGSEDACEKMGDVGDPIELLPNYLQDVLENVEDKYGDAKHDLHVPKECVEAGAMDRKKCSKIMFKLHAPPECQEALEQGIIDPKNEREARKSYDEIMFEAEAPEECLEAGIRDFQECDRYIFELDAPEECLEAGLTGSGRDDWKKCEQIRFMLDAPEECLEAGLTGEGRNDWKECEIIRFELEAPQECLDAGLTGEGRDDWKECDAIKFGLEAPQECLDAGIDPYDRRAWDKCKPIQFQAEAPQECLDAGLTGEGRNDWKECDIIRFELESPEECLDAGLTGERQSDWRKCKQIQFVLEAPQECLDAGLDGSGRNDWKECDKIRKETEDQGARREDCKEEQLHICEEGYCKCVDKDGEPGESDGDSSEESECKDGCQDECPDADRTDCVDDGMRCECYYEEESDGEGEGEDSGSDEGANGGDEENGSDEEPGGEEGEESGEGEGSGGEESGQEEGEDTSEGSDEGANGGEETGGSESNEESNKESNIE